MKRLFFPVIGFILLLGHRPASGQTTQYSRNGLEFEVEVSNACNPAGGNGAIIFRAKASGSGIVRIVLISGPVSTVFPDVNLTVDNSTTYAYSPPAPQNGTYEFIVRDPFNDAAVVNTFTAEFDGVRMTPLTAPTLQQTNLSDNTSCDVPSGQLSVEVLGGSRSPALGVPGSFSYEWTSNAQVTGLPLGGTFDGSTPLDLADLLGADGLPGGTYTLEVEDLYSSCSVKQDFVLADPKPVAYVLTGPTSVSCAATDIPLSLDDSDGADVEYEVYENGQPTGITATGTGNALIILLPGNRVTEGGTYVYTVRAVSGFCLPRFMTGSVSISIPGPVDFNSTVTPPTCPGASNAVLSLTGTGGDGNYQYSIDNGVTFSAANTFNGLAAGDLIVVVKDGLDCTSEAATVTITDPTPVTFNATPTDPSCNGGADGKITIAASGGSGTYTYSKDNGANFQTSAEFSGLGPGSFTIVVNDDNGCPGGSSAVTLNEPSAVTATANPSPTVCATSSDGSITVNASGGSGLFTYSTDNGTTFTSNNPVIGLAAGAYQVVAKDSKGCTSPVLNISVPAATAVTFNTIAKNPSCTGDVNGSITINATGGNGVFSYSINNGTDFQPEAVFNGLTPGAYSVVVRDGNNCQSPASTVTLADPTTITFTSVATAADCNGGSTGSIAFTPAGGSGTYSYSVDNGVTFVTNATVGGLAAGNYLLVVKDSNDCLAAPGNATVTEPSAISVIISSSSPNCFGSTTGTISVTASGGNGGFTFSRDNGATFQAGQTFSNLTGGSYQVVVKDTRGCLSTPQTVTLNSPTQVSFTSSATGPLCNGGTTGTITISASGGSGPYTFSVNNGTSFAATNPVTGLAAGTYSVIARDSQGCTSTSSPVTLTAPAALTFTSATTQPLCFGSFTGSITINGSGGTGTLTYSNNGGTTFAASNVFSNLASGTYGLRIRDSNNCTSSVTNVVLTAPTQLTHTATTTASTCNNTSTGSITMNGSGGSGSYAYSIDNGISFISVAVFPNLAPGSYTTVAKDINGCFSTPRAVTVNAPPAISVTTTPKATSCAGSANGSIVVAASGGNGNFTYSINNGANFVSGTTFNNLAGGVYPVVVRDFRGCLSNPTNVTIAEPAAVTFTSSAIPVTCFGNNNGSITITASGGSSVYSYSINNGTTFVSTATFSNLPPANYPLAVRDDKGCTATPASVTVVSPAQLTASVTTTPERCRQSADAGLTITANGGNGGYAYSIDNGSQFQSASSFTGLSAGSFVVLVKDEKNCTSTATSVIIAAVPALTFTATPAAATTCVPGNEGSIQISATGGTGAFTYSSDNGISFQAGPVLSGLTAGTYQVVVRDANDCLATAQAVSVSAAEPISLTATSADVRCNGENNGAISAAASGGDANYSYSSNNFISSQPSGDFNSLSPASYTITARDGRGCGKTVTVVVNEPAVLTQTLSKTDITCNSKQDGTITITAAGGNAGYAYSIDNGANFQTAGAFTGLAPATFQVLVKDGKGCLTSAQNQTLSEPDAISLTVTHTDVTSCLTGNDGTLSVSAIGGTGGFTYTLDNNAYQPAGEFNNLLAGLYVVHAKDGNGCIRTEEEILLAPGGPTLTFATTPLSCFENQTGTIVITGSDGTAPLEYSVDAGAQYQSGGTFENLTAGVYRLRIRDAGGCTFVATATVTQPTIVTAAITSAPASCNGGSDGSLLVSGTGGNGGYEFSIDNGLNFSPSGNFSQLSAGTYSFLVRDVKGCLSDPTSGAVTQPDPLVFTTGTTDATCLNNDGIIRLTSVGGGTAPYRYVIDNQETALPADNAFIGYPAKDYVFTVKDDNDCESTGTVTVSFPGNIVATGLPVSPDCFGNGDNGKIELTITNPGTFQAGISTDPALPPTGFITINSNGNGTGTIGSLTTGTYHLTVTHNTLCTLKSTIVVSGGPTPVGGTVATTDAVCFDEPGELTVSGLTGGAGLPFRIDVLQGAQTILTRTVTSDEAGAPVRIPITTQGEYQARIAQDQSTLNGCATLIRDQPIAFTIGGPDAQLDTLSTERTGTFVDRATGRMTGSLVESGADTYESSLVLTQGIDPEHAYSSPFALLNRNDDGRIAFEYTRLYAGTYTLTVRDGFGCERDFILEIGADPSLFIPNIFTPNADGVNDTFFIRNLPAGSTLVVTNRWGGEVFTTRNYDNTWTGSKQPDGIYYYRLVAGGRTYTGWLELMSGD